MLVRWEPIPIDTFDFQRIKERFHRRIIVTAAFAAHTGNNAVSLE